MIIPNFVNYLNSVSKQPENYLYYYTKGDSLFKILYNLNIQVSRYNNVHKREGSFCVLRQWNLCLKRTLKLGKMDLTRCVIRNVLIQSNES